jgi:TolB protein
MTVRHALLALLALGSLASVFAGSLETPLAGQTSPPQQPSEVMTTITGDPGAPPRYAVPDFLALSNDAEVQAAAKVIGEVLWNDLDFEREFYMIPRDTYRSIPVPRSLEDIPYDRWRELGADGLIAGTVERAGTGIRVTARLYSVRDGRSVFGKEYSGSAANPRLYAHTLADELHQQQRALAGVARTKLSFSSDRDNERVPGSIENRGVKEIYIADYDAANQRRVTVNRGLNITPVWTPDGRGIAYTSYRRGSPDIFISLIYQGTLENPTAGRGDNFLPAFSPDGTRFAFMSNRDGNPELYVMNRDGSGLRRLTTHPAIDVTPTWAPSGTQIAFTSDRSGSPQIYIIGADGLNLRKLTSESYCDRPTWSPAPYNEVAYASRTGPGYDIMALDLATGERRQLTFGEGSNESPSYSPNGRHITFTSTRAGRTHVFTMARDGKNLRQITKAGNNYTPSWSR